MRFQKQEQVRVVLQKRRIKRRKRKKIKRKIITPIIVILKHLKKAMRMEHIQEMQPVKESSLKNIV